MTKPDQAKKFVDASGVEVLAPSVGNLHGMVKGGNPALNPERVAAILEATKTPLVLHGGSGSTDADFVKVIKAGISLVHISTELRVAYRKGLEEAFAADPNQIAPYRFAKQALDAVKVKAAERIRLFWGL